MTVENKSIIYILTSYARYVTQRLQNIIRDVYFNIVCFIKFTSSNPDNTKSVYDLPGPMGYPVIGTLPDYFQKNYRGKVHELHKERHRVYGRFIKERLGLQLNVNLADPKLVEELWHQEGRTPYRPPYQAWAEYNEYRNRMPGVITSQGEDWYKLRKAISRHLLSGTCAMKNIQSLDKVVPDLVKRLLYVREKTGPDNVVPNLCNVLYLFSLECIVSILLDCRLGCLEPSPNERAQTFIQATIDMFDTGFKMIVGARVHRWLHTRWWKKHVHAWDNILKIAQDLIVEKLANVHKGHVSNDGILSDTGVLSQMLSEGKLSVEEVSTSMSEIMGGAIDSSANALAFTLYLVASHPEVQEKLYQEIFSTTQGESFQLKHLQHVTHIKHVIKETLRLYPVIPINARVLQNDAILDGYSIPKGTCVLMNVYTMSRDAEYFKCPDKFWPDRWIEEDITPASRMFAWSPFGYGGRSCLGRRIAETEIALAVCTLVQQFCISPHSSNVIDPCVKTIMSPGSQLNLVFTDRN